MWTNLLETLALFVFGKEILNAKIVFCAVVSNFELNFTVELKFEISCEEHLRSVG